MNDGTQEAVNPKTGMTHRQMKNFIHDHFEQFVNRQNLGIADVNFAEDFVDHGADVPPGLPPGPAGAKQYVGGAYRRFPDIHVTIEDMIAEDDKVVVRNRWTGTDSTTNQRMAFSGIVIWRIADRQIRERWAYLQAAQPAA
jgi:predicted ester cyclase